MRPAPRAGPLRGCPLVCGARIARHRREPLSQRLPRMRRLCWGVSLRCHEDESRDRSARGHRGYVRRLRCVCQGLPPSDHRAALQRSARHEGLCRLLEQGEGRRGHEGVQGGMYRLRQVLQGLHPRGHHYRQQPLVYWFREMQAVPQVRARVPHTRHTRSQFPGTQGRACRCPLSRNRLISPR